MSKILVIAEKPNAARDYASVLGCYERHKGYIEGPKYVVTWALGHLCTLKEPHEYREEWKKWSLDLLPIVPDKFEIKLVEDVKEQFLIIKKLIHRDDVVSIINGGDAGREGELIQRYILEQAGNKKPVKRLWVSSLTKDAIEDGFKNLKRAEEFDKLYESALARSQVDWLYGMNYTRAFTKKYGNGKNVLSVGRCQTPLLKLIVDRDMEIDNFKPQPFYEIISNFNDYSGKYIDKDKNSRIFNKEEVKVIVNKIKGRTGIITEINEEKKSFPAPLLFNLNTLSQKMNKKYGFTAQHTLEVLQNLYETHKIATYPRAAAKVISESVFNEVKRNINNIAFGEFASYIPKLKIVSNKRYVNDSKIEDHHAIIPDFKNRDIPTIYNKLCKDEKLLFDELVKSVLAIFLPNYEYLTTTLITNVEDCNFITKGKQELQLGWRSLYADEKDSDDIDSIVGKVSKGEKKKVVNVDTLSKQTKSKPRYTEAQLLSDMEKYGIGTQATMSGLIETLKNRKYIDEVKKALISNDFGKTFIKLINIDDIKSVELTSILEEKLEGINKGTLSKEDLLKVIIIDLEKNINKIRSTEGSTSMSFDDSLGVCPICKKGQIVRNRKGHGCSAYKEGCKFFIGDICGKIISSTQVKKLITNGITDIIKGFKSQKGTSFDAKLKLNKENGKVEFEFNDTKSKDKSKLSCPKCKEKMFDSDKVCKCDKCNIVIFKNIAGKKITDAQLKMLIEKGKTNVIKGFTSKSDKKFDASLKLQDNGRVTFDFN